MVGAAREGGLSETEAGARWRRWAAIGLLLLGLAQMAGDLLGSHALRGLAAATTASPAPRVFSTVRGLETYSTRVMFEWTERDGVARSLELTPEVYQRFGGPSKGRNVYGAAFAYGPVLVSDPLTRPMFAAALRRSLCGARPLLRAIGVDVARIVGEVRVRFEPRPGTDLGGLPRVIVAACS